MSRRYFVVFADYLRPSDGVNGERKHVQRVVITGLLTLTALEYAVADAEKDSGLQACYVTITGYNEVTKQEWATFMERPDDYQAKQWPAGDVCVLL